MRSERRSSLRSRCSGKGTDERVERRPASLADAGRRRRSAHAGGVSRVVSRPVRVRGYPELLGGVREADGAPSAALERTMHRPRVAHEVCAGPRAASEELVGEDVALESIASSARGHEVADRVRPSPRERVDVIERGLLQGEVLGAVHTPSAAIAEGGVLQGAFRVATERRMVACVRGAVATRCARSNHPDNPTSRHRTSPERTTPRPGLAGAGCREWRGGDTARRDRHRGMNGSRTAWGRPNRMNLPKWGTVPPHVGTIVA